MPGIPELSPRRARNAPRPQGRPTLPPPWVVFDAIQCVVPGPTKWRVECTTKSSISRFYESGSRGLSRRWNWTRTAKRSRSRSASRDRSFPVVRCVRRRCPGTTAESGLGGISTPVSTQRSSRPTSREVRVKSTAFGRLGFRGLNEDHSSRPCSSVWLSIGLRKLRKRPLHVDSISRGEKSMGS